VSLTLAYNLKVWSLALAFDFTYGQQAIMLAVGPFYAEVAL
jgi:hypothetical protein